MIVLEGLKNFIQSVGLIAPPFIVNLHILKKVLRVSNAVVCSDMLGKIVNAYKVL